MRCGGLSGRPPVNPLLDTHVRPGRELQIALRAYPDPILVQRALDVHRVASEASRLAGRLHRKPADFRAGSKARSVSGPGGESVCRILGPANASQLFRLKQCSGEPGLPDNAQQRTAPNRMVQGNRDGYAGCLQTLLRDPVAAALANRGDPIPFQNQTTSEPERTRSLPNRYLDLGHKNLPVKSPVDFGRGGFEEQCERRDEVRSRFFNRGALAGNVEFRAQRDKTVFLTFDNRGHALRSIHDSSLRQSALPPFP
jgi:hypothetical protein